jgi:hypothetical protein
MSWLLSNWIWILLGVAFIAFHLFGHGGHGGHNHKAGRAAPLKGQDGEPVDDADVASRESASGHGHHVP